MTVTRMNLWGLGNDWNPTMLWYARAVRDLQTRPITDATSWTYLAAMHGFDPDLWQVYGYIDSTTPLPPAAARRRDWDQCQHQSGYFLPWHRGYLAAIQVKTGTVDKGIGLRVVENGGGVLGNITVVIVKDDFGAYSRGLEYRSEMILDE